MPQYSPSNPDTMRPSPNGSCRRMTWVLPSARFPEVGSAQARPPGDLASPDTFTGETQSLGLTPGRRDAFKAKADNAGPTARSPATPSRTTQKPTAPGPTAASPTAPGPTAPGPTARVRVVRIRMVLTPLTCRDLPLTATCRTRRLTGGVACTGARGRFERLPSSVAAEAGQHWPAHTGGDYRGDGERPGRRSVRHVSRPGYLPATPVPDDAAVSDLWLVWLDAVALAAVDATEPNYERIPLPTRYPVRLTMGQPVMPCWVYHRGTAI